MGRQVFGTRMESTSVTPTLSRSSHKRFTGCAHPGADGACVHHGLELRGKRRTTRRGKPVLTSLGLFMQLQLSASVLHLGDVPFRVAGAPDRGFRHAARRGGRIPNMSISCQLHLYPCHWLPTSRTRDAVLCDIVFSGVVSNWDTLSVLNGMFRHFKVLRYYVFCTAFFKTL